MLEIDKIHLALPFYGARKIQHELNNRGFSVGRDRVRRLMRKMGLEAIYRKPKTSIPQPGNHIYPYLLKDLQIERLNQIWATDITYLPMAKGFAYLVAIIDLYSRRVMSHGSYPIRWMHRFAERPWKMQFKDSAHRKSLIPIKAASSHQTHLRAFKGPWR